ncbi:MAG: hypothetical protein U7126_19675 [Microcoleus sp.]
MRPRISKDGLKEFIFRCVRIKRQEEPRKACGVDKPLKSHFETTLKQAVNSQPVQLTLLRICIGFTERFAIIAQIEE